jgi:phage terminase large subunit-like protein
VLRREAAAVTRDQARILFAAAQQMVRKTGAFPQGFGVGVGADALYQEATASAFAPVSSDAKALDGLTVQAAVCDEIALPKTSEIYDVVLTAMGKRRHPRLSISTAAGNTTGIGQQLWDYGVQVLEGAQLDDVHADRCRRP